ncbi:MAG TPA: tRNA (adenosine(37)-N6)-dimethylallyltransferase MiaA [Candidatus Paceibacterota bacterium]|nr:tRNA (adenosine(37)-N6)-dimethylallyltransferase MiaA [Candidatus Paceibacterota bacterium]
MQPLPRIVCIIGPTASGKSARAIERARNEGGEVISVDSRQVYRTLDIGTEKLTPEEMQGVPHHLIDIRDPKEPYSAGDFVEDARRLIADITARGKLPILAGGTHFYFDALLYGLPPDVPPDARFREELEPFTNDELLARVRELDPKRAEELDPQNRRRLIRALEVINVYGSVPERTEAPYAVAWEIVNPDREVLRERISARLVQALERGLIEEVKRVRDYVGEERLAELGLEYRIVGEYLAGRLEESELHPRLLAKLLQYARRQRAWIRKLNS